MGMRGDDSRVLAAGAARLISGVAFYLAPVWKSSLLSSAARAARLGAKIAVDASWLSRLAAGERPEPRFSVLPWFQLCRRPGRPAESPAVLGRGKAFVRFGFVALDFEGFSQSGPEFLRVTSKETWVCRRACI